MRFLSRARFASSLRRSALIAAACTVLSQGSARAQFTAPSERELRGIPPGDVVAVNFEGNRELSNAELSTIIATQVTGGISTFLYYHSWGMLGSPYQKRADATLSRDTAVINLYYRDHGFLSARSSYRIGQNRDDLKLYSDYHRREKLARNPAQTKSEAAPTMHDTVTFHIQEGPAYTISHVSLAGLEVLPNEFQPELTEHVTIKSGQRWSRAAAAKEIERLTGVMIEKGYPNFRFDTIVVPYHEIPTNVNVSIYFTPGHRYRYGKVNIVYDTNTAERSHVAMNVVTAQLMTQKGDWYKLSDVQRSEANLMKLGTFDLARVSLDTNYIKMVPDSLRDGTEIPLEIYLRMRRTGELPFNIYAGTGSQNFVMGGGVGVAWRNFTQTADYLNFQVSYQPFPPTQTRMSSSIDYMLPYIGMGRIPLILGLGVSIDSQTALPNISTYRLINYSAHAGSTLILSTLDDKTSLSPDLTVEYTYGTGDSIAQAILPHNQVNLLPSISYQDDRTNDQLNPTGGDVLSASFETGLPFTFNGHPSSAYVKLVPQVKLYHDLGSTGSDVIAFRLRAGGSYLYYQNDPLRAPSFNHRFFGGGASSNRGWADQALLVSADSNSKAAFGGFNDLEGNLEFRYAPFQYPQEFTSWQKFSSGIRLVVFYDIGNVWDNVLFDPQSPAARSFSKLAQTLGLGLRYNTFFGAIRADWGLKLYDPSGQFSSDVVAITPNSQGSWIFSQRVPFRGGWTFNWHFGIGQAF